MKKLMLLGAAVLAMQAVPALAQDATSPKAHEGKGMEHMFTEQDADKDGSISKAEFTATGEKRFDAMDANKDGKLTKEEIKAHHDAMKAKWKEKRGAMKDKTSTDAPAAE